MMKLIVRKPEVKKKKRYSAEEVDWYTSILPLKISYQKIYIFWYFVVYDEVLSSFSQIVE